MIAVRAAAPGIAARSDKTRSGLAVGKSPVPQGTHPEDRIALRMEIERSRGGDGDE